MSGFTFLLEAFTLLMGLAMAEVLRGFARVLKLRARRKAGIDPDAARIRIGWLVPLLGLFVIFDQSTFFLHMYGLREQLVFNAGSVIGILVLIGWYYLVASLVFPDEPRDWPDFDRWYWQQKRWVLGGVLGINVLATIAATLVMPAGYQEEMAASLSPAFLIASLFAMMVFPALIALMFTKRAWLDTVLLGLCISVSLVFAVLTIGEVQPG